MIGKQNLVGTHIHTFAESEVEVVRGSPLPTDNFEGRNWPQQTIYCWKGNLMASRIHFKYWKYFDFAMSNFREMTPQWFQKKLKLLKMNVLYIALKLVI